MRRVACAVACVALAGCGDDERAETANQILPRTEPAPVVTTPSEGGVIEDTPVEAPKPEPKTGERRKPSTSPSASPSPAPAPDEPVTAPNSKGPFGPEQVAAPPARKASPARREIESRVTAYLRAIATANGKRACEQMTAAGQKAIARKIAQIAPETQGAACREAIVLYQGAYGDAIKRPKVRAVRVAGKTATAIGPLEQVAKLQLQGGRWLITEYGQ